MRRYLLDTTPLTAYVFGRAEAVRRLEPWLAREEAATSILVYAEVVEYLRSQADCSARHRALRELLPGACKGRRGVVVLVPRPCRDVPCLGVQSWEAGDHPGTAAWDASDGANRAQMEDGSRKAARLVEDDVGISVVHGPAILHPDVRPGAELALRAALPRELPASAARLGRYKPDVDQFEE